MDALINAIACLTNFLKGFFPTGQRNNQHLIKISQITVTGAPPPQAIPNTPKPYNGNPYRLTGFLQELELYFILTNTTSTEHRVIFALGLVHGGKENYATVWADTVRNRIITRKKEIEHAKNLASSSAAANTTPPIIPTELFLTWDEFCEEFNKQFKLFDTRERAAQMLRNVVQGNKTFQEYVATFRTYYLLSEYNEEAGLEEFKRGLRKGLRMKLLSWPPPERNTDGSVNLNNWIKRACKLDNAHRRL